MKLPEGFLLAGLAGAMAACSSAPRGLGIADGRLAPCPNKPNCVSSQAAASDQQHYIDGLSYTGEPAQARERLERALGDMKRAKVTLREPNYWRAEFTSALFRFV